MFSSVTPGTVPIPAGLAGALPGVTGIAPCGGEFGVIGMMRTLRGALGSSAASCWLCGGTPMTTRPEGLALSSSPSRLRSFLSVLGKLLPSGTTGLTLLGPALLAVMRGAGPLLAAKKVL